MSITLRSRRGAIGTSWQGIALRDAAEKILGVGRAAGGKKDARSGRVQWLDVVPGTARADVLDEMGEVRSARLDLPAFRHDDRSALLRVAAEHPELPARLAAGQYPQEIEQELSRSATSLLPRDAAELTHDCSCLDWPGPCRHVAALVYVLVEAVDEHPQHLLTLRGLTLEDLVAAARTRSPDSEGPEADGPPEESEPEHSSEASMEPALLDSSHLSPVIGSRAATLLTEFYRAANPT